MSDVYGKNLEPAFLGTIQKDTICLITPVFLPVSLQHVLEPARNKMSKM